MLNSMGDKVRRNLTELFDKEKERLSQRPARSSSKETPTGKRTGSQRHNGGGDAAMAELAAELAADDAEATEPLHKRGRAGEEKDFVIRSAFFHKTMNALNICHDEELMRIEGKVDKAMEQASCANVLAEEAFKLALAAKVQSNRVESMANTSEAAVVGQGLDVDMLKKEMKSARQHWVGPPQSAFPPPSPQPTLPLPFDSARQRWQGPSSPALPPGTERLP